MNKKNADNLLINEEFLKIIRNRYFPLIKSNIITGYNLYSDQFDHSSGELFINYLHSELKHSDRHLLELNQLLQAEGFLEEKIIINHSQNIYISVHYYLKSW